MKRIILFAGVLVLALLIYTRLHYHQWLASLDISHGMADLVLGFLIFILSANLVVVFLSWLYRRSKGLKQGEADNIILALQNIYYLLVAGGIITTVIGFFGIDPKTLFTSLSIVAAAIAIISKEYISEIISGIIFSFVYPIAIMAGTMFYLIRRKGRDTAEHPQPESVPPAVGTAMATN